MDTIEIVRTTYGENYVERDLNGNLVFVRLGASKYEWCTWGVYSNGKSVGKFRVKKLKVNAPN